MPFNDSSPEATTVVSLLERAAGRPDQGLRLVDRGEREEWLPWPEIHRRAHATAGALHRHGVAPGDRVALIYPTCAEFFAAFFGTLVVGAVPVPLYPPVRLGRLAEYLERTAAMVTAAGARLILADARVRRILGPAVAAARPELGCHTLADLPAGTVAAASIGPDDLALIQFSSGTTVDPKPVALSHRAVTAQPRLLNANWPDSDELRHSGVSWLPLYHDMGLIGCVLPALERPGTLTLLPPEAFVAWPALWLRAISRYRATVSPAPNFAFGLCVDKIRDDELEGVDLSCWLIALNGAEAIAPEVLRAFQSRFARWGFRAEALTPVYGLSEAALAVTFSDLAAPFMSRTFDRDQLAVGRRAVPATDGRELVSVGRPLPGFEVVIAGAAAAGEIGEVLVRGPSLMTGYYGRPEATAAALADGWLHTGDLGFLHDGELYLVGRAKDVLILNGRNHAPEEVELALGGVAGVRTGCAVAASYLPEGAPREQLMVFVEAARELAAAAYGDLAAACRSAILAAAGLAVDTLLVVPPGTLPRTSSGKLRRGDTLRRHLAGELAPAVEPGALRLAGAVVRSSLAFARLARERVKSDE